MYHRIDEQTRGDVLDYLAIWDCDMTRCKPEIRQKLIQDMGMDDSLETDYMVERYLHTRRIRSETPDAPLDRREAILTRLRRRIENTENKPY